MAAVRAKLRGILENDAGEMLEVFLPHFLPNLAKLPGLTPETLVSKTARVITWAENTYLWHVRRQYKLTPIPNPFGVRLSKGMEIFWFPRAAAMKVLDRFRNDPDEDAQKLQYVAMLRRQMFEGAWKLFQEARASLTPAPVLVVQPARKTAKRARA